MHRVFISYHHANDQKYKDKLVAFAEQYQVFINASVNTKDIDEGFSDQRIREIIRDDYLRDSTVTVVLVGLETSKRKHVDWEIYSSMIDGQKNKRSGIVAINLPDTGSLSFTASHKQEKQVIYPDCKGWTGIKNRSEYERKYPYMPDRIIDNLVDPSTKVSVAPWERIYGNPDGLSCLIDSAFEYKGFNDYNLSTPMRRKNS